MTVERISVYSGNGTFSNMINKVLTHIIIHIVNLFQVMIHSKNIPESASHR